MSVFSFNIITVTFQVCGSVRTEPCTPLQCEGEEICPPEGTPACTKGQTCVGALPLSQRADADVKDVKARLDKLTKKISEAAEKVHPHTHTCTHADTCTDVLMSLMAKNCNCIT